MKCLCYYIAEPMPTPDCCTLNSDRILSVSESGFSRKFPDLTKCFWTNYPQSDRDAYAEHLGLGSDEFSEFCRLVNDLFSSRRLSVDARFRSLDDAVSLSRFIRNDADYRLVGLFADAETFADLEKENYFSTFGAGDYQLGGISIGCEILGSEMLGDGYFSFESFIVNSLNTVLEKEPDFSVDRKTGLIQNTYAETKRFCELIQGMGEPVIWLPFELREYNAK